MHALRRPPLSPGALRLLRIVHAAGGIEPLSFCEASAWQAQRWLGNTVLKVLENVYYDVNMRLLRVTRNDTVGRPGTASCREA